MRYDRSHIPQLIQAFKPSGYSAWRIAVATEYAYTPSPLEGEGQGEGGTLLIDLAVTAGHNGKINTVDLTDPYKPTVMGVTKDSDGNEVIATVTDIAISKTSGIAYATAGASVYVIDIKDPNNPKLLNIITEVPVNCPPTSDNCTQTTALGTSTALVEKDGWVYLANQQKGMRALDLDPVYLKLYCTDKEFSNVSGKFCNDYYPSLGEKTIVLQGYNAAMGPFNDNDKVKVKFNTCNPPDPCTSSQNVVVTPDPAQACPADPNDPRPCAIFKNEKDPDTQEVRSLARFKVKTTQEFQGSDVVLDFKIEVPGEETVLLGQNETCETKPEVRLKARNNANVLLGEALRGEAVYVYDPATLPAINQITMPQQTGTDLINMDEIRGFDFVQELLNQVTPRMRDLRAYNSTTNQWVSTTYNLLHEDGPYNTSTADNLKMFKENFNMISVTSIDNAWRIGNSKASFTNANGKVQYPTDGSDDTTDIFRKIMKDYNHRTAPAESAAWLNKIIDQGTLVGKEKKDADVMINGYSAPGTSAIAKDTGLYELYNNVVRIFNTKMIGIADDYEKFDGVKWRDRIDGTERTGVTYSFGRKIKLIEYEEKVEPANTNCFSKSSLGEKKILHYAISSGTGTVKPELTTKPTVDQNNTVTATQCTRMNSKQFPGLTSAEMNSFVYGRPHTATYTQNGQSQTYEYYFFTDAALTTRWQALEQFKPSTWAGIDCAGLVQRSMMVGNTTAMKNIGVKLSLFDLTDNYTDFGYDSRGIGSMQFDCDGKNGKCKVTPDALTNIRSGHVYKMTKPQEKQIKKGDLIFYDLPGTDHVAMVHADKPTCIETTAGENNQTQTTNQAQSTCTYNIIHAYGVDNYKKIVNGAEQKVFSRKVLITPNDVSTTIDNPTGFGRIKLWD